MCSAASFESFSASLRAVFSGYSSGDRLEDDHFNRLGLELFRLQFEHNQCYRRLCEAQGKIPGSVIRWSDIPAMPTSAFKEWEITCLEGSERGHWFCSSGTTAQRPSRHFHNSASLSLYEESLWPPFQRALLPESAAFGKRLRWLILTPRTEEAPHSSLVHMFESVRAKVSPGQWGFYSHPGATGDWELDTEAVLKALTEAQHCEQPVLVLGTAFLFVRLLDEMRRRNLRLALPIASRALETGGYKGKTRAVPKHELHAEMSRQLGLEPESIISEYGMAELSSQAYDHIAGVAGERALHFPPWARALVVSPETGLPVSDGEIGLIRIFDLANAYSALAIQTEDLGRRCGEGFELLGRAEQAEPRGCSLLAA